MPVSPPFPKGLKMKAWFCGNSEDCSRDGSIREMNHSCQEKLDRKLDNGRLLRRLITTLSSFLYAQGRGFEARCPVASYSYPSSASLSSVMPKKWAISCTTVTSICSSSSSRVSQVSSSGPWKSRMVSGNSGGEVGERSERGRPWNNPSNGSSGAWPTSSIISGVGRFWTEMRMFSRCCLNSSGMRLMALLTTLSNSFVLSFILNHTSKRYYGRPTSARQNGLPSSQYWDG